MRIVSVGYPGSQFLLPATAYLQHKYLPGFLFSYISHSGPNHDWSRTVREYLGNIDDKLVILTLDDYLISAPMNRDSYELAVNQMKNGVHAFKLHKTSVQEHKEYPVTTQYTIWDRECLIDLLKRTTDPWDFEINGSGIFRSEGKISLMLQIPAIEYNVHSALSKRWKGVNIVGLNDEDRVYLTNYVLR